MQQIIAQVVMPLILGIGFAVGCAFASEAQPELSDSARAKQLRAAMEKLRPLHNKLGKPKPGDWLIFHPEPGQTFQQYLACEPVRPVGKRRTIHIQPLGAFTETQRKIVNLTADFMGRYFSVPVKVCDDLALSVIPADARRVRFGNEQILTGHVLEKVLKPRLPADAAAYIAFTASDLWPGEGWNFVFGEASLRERVGVWSICRNGEPDASEDDFRLCLLRTMKTATHETGHMFSMQHCTAYECNMCGSNSREESDRRPIALCPECWAKVCWATRADPVERFKKLAEFCNQNGLMGYAGFYERSMKALEAKE